MTMPQVGVDKKDSFGSSIAHKLDFMIGNREFGQLVYQAKAAAQPKIRGLNGQVALSTTVVLQVRPANPRRSSLMIQNLTGTQLVFWGYETPGGPGAAVSSTTGSFLAAAVGASVSIQSQGAIYAIAATATQTVAWTEEEYVE